MIITQWIWTWGWLDVNGQANVDGPSSAIWTPFEAGFLFRVKTTAVQLRGGGLRFASINMSLTNGQALSRPSEMAVS